MLETVRWSYMLVGYIFFFFSSRRRHTRLQGDWSSDVCSSDLLLAHHRVAAALGRAGLALLALVALGGAGLAFRLLVAGLLLGLARLLVGLAVLDRKSTRLNSSHLVISYAVFCLKKKNIHAYT